MESENMKVNINSLKSTMNKLDKIVHTHTKYENLENFIIKKMNKQELEYIKSIENKAENNGEFINLETYEINALNKIFDSLSTTNQRVLKSVQNHRQNLLGNNYQGDSYKKTR